MDIELQLAVERLHARYGHALDGDRLEDWPGFFTENGRYRIRRIYSGENWNPDLQAPLSAPGVKVSEPLVLV